MLDLCNSEKWTCWICGGAIEVGWETLSPSAPSRDHVVPRSVFRKKPESYSEEFYHANIKLAHRYCNSERKTAPVTDATPYIEGLKKAQQKWDKKHKK